MPARSAGLPVVALVGILGPMALRPAALALGGFGE